MKRNIFFSLLFLLMIHPIIDMLFASDTPKKPIICILFGPPGTGSGDFAARTSQNMNMPLISVAKLTMAYINEDSILGKQVKQAINSEQNIPDSLVLNMFYDYIRKNKNPHGYVIEGFPKNLDLTRKIYTALCDNYSWLVLYVDVKDATLIQRAAGRRVCPHCGRVYHLEDSPPEEGKECDKCHALLEFRGDDKPELTQKRLDTFHTIMRPLIDFFQEQKILHIIDGNKHIGPSFHDDVYADITQEIESQEPAPVAP